MKAIKYWGIHFDERLSFYNHIEQIADKSRALTYMLNRTAKLNWGLGHKSLKTIYEGGDSTTNDIRGPSLGRSDYQQKMPQ